MINRKRNNIIIYIFLIMLLIIICILAIYYLQIYTYEKKERQEIDKLDISLDLKDSDRNNYYNYEIICNKKVNQSDNTPYNDNITTENKYESIKDCIITIPDIDLKKFVYTGNDREKHLANYELITAANDMYYKNGGNYIICGHASRLYGHSLNRLNEVKNGTEIEIITNNKVEKYTVDKVYYDDMNNTSKYCKQTKDKQITIVSCAKYISLNSYIIVKASIK